ncbi:MAG: hypothetical protein M3Q36_04490 [bacterium]|nr:hypothetical protein [bacterium]
MNSKRLELNERGMVFFAVLFIGLLMTFIGLSLADLALAQLKRANEDVYISNALLAAEAGIEHTIYQFNESGPFGGIATTEYYNNTDQGSATYETVVTAGTIQGERIITSLGRAYNRTGKLVKERRIRVSTVGTQSLTPNVYAGAGGLILSGSVNISNTDIYVEGFIQLSNASARIGSPSDNMRKIEARNVWCMVSGSYPEPCPSGTQPITLNNNAEIYGNVCANGQTNSTNIFELDTGCAVLPRPNPYTYDRDAHIASMDPAKVYAPNNSLVACGNGANKTWQDGTTITGSITINSNSCSLTISGDVYIKGNLDLSKGTVRIADGLTTRPVIAVDGTINTRNNLTIIANDLNVGGRFISYKCKNESGVAVNGCSTLSDSALYQSRSNLTVEAKSSDGAIGSIMQSYWGRINIGASGTIASAVGQSVELSGNGAVVFGDNLASDTLSTWTVRSYQLVFE